MNNKFLKLPQDSRFTNKGIILFLIPIFFEQLLIASMSIADTLMISRLPNSQYMIAAIANVTRIDTLIKQIFVALAAGGSIFVAQYVGAKKNDLASQSLKLSLYSMTVFAILITALMLLFDSNILTFLFGLVEKEVMKQSLTYYDVTTCALPFMAIFTCCNASFRAMQRSKISFYSSIVLMVINLSVKYFFIYHLDMGILGAGLSLLIAYAVTDVFLIILLSSKKNSVRLTRIFRLQWNTKMFLGIYKLAIPTGIENGLFQVGSLTLQTLIATLGVTAMNANHLANTVAIQPTYCLITAFTLGIITFVGQCMGAKRPDEAEFYVRHIMKMTRVFTITALLIITPIMPFALKLFGMTAEINRQAFIIYLIYTVFAILVYPESFTLANALRATGDTKFPMITSVSTMFLFRIGFAYILVLGLKLGIYGIWIAMVLDWVIRSTIFRIRFKKGAWKNKKVIE